MNLESNFTEGLQDNSSESDKILRYGCQIFLNFYDDTNQRFIGFSSGFNKNKIRLRLFDKISQNGYYIRGLFKIYPCFSNKEFVEIKNKYFKDSKQQIESITGFEKRSSFFFF